MVTKTQALSKSAESTLHMAQQEGVGTEMAVATLSGKRLPVSSSGPSTAAPEMTPEARHQRFTETWLQQPVIVPSMMTPEERHRWIARRAYFRAEKRGFAPGHEEEDWLEAEQEVKALADYWLP